MKYDPKLQLTMLHKAKSAYPSVSKQMGKEVSTGNKQSDKWTEVNTLDHKTQFRFAVIERIHLPQCTVGRLSIMGVHIGYTIEQPWRENRRRISCIYSGFHKIIPSVRYAGPKTGAPTIRFPDVSGRQGILSHTGRSIKDTTGCILVVDSLVRQPADMYVARKIGKAWQTFYDMLVNKTDSRDAMVEIRNTFYKVVPDSWTV